MTDSAILASLSPDSTISSPEFVLPLISIIIPCHNVAQTIRATLHSARRQLYPNFEIICVENGSSDDTLHLLHEVALEEPRLRITQSTPGLGSARMAGVQVAAGTLVAFLDGDDFLEPDFLSEMQAAMAREGADMVQCAFRYAWPDRSSVSRAAAGVISGDYCALSIENPGALPWLQPQQWNKLYRKEILDGIVLRDICFEDAESLPRIVERCRKIVNIPDALYTYNKRLSAITEVGFSNLKRADWYLTGSYESCKPYLAAEAYDRRKLWNLPLPACTHANQNNYLKAVDAIIADAPPEEQRVFWEALTRYTAKMQALARPDDYAELVGKSYKMVNIPENIATAPNDLVAMAKAVPANNTALNALEAAIPELDATIAKDPDLWVFASWGHYGRHTMDNPRAIFETVKATPRIRKVVLMNGAFEPSNFTEAGQNVTFLPLFSEEALHVLMQAGVIVTGYALHGQFGYRKLPKHPDRKILQAWHGIPIKRIGLTLPSKLEPFWKQEHSRYWAVPSSSELDRQTMIKSFAPRDPDRVKLTGLPRHDFLACAESSLPKDYREDLDKIRARLKGRRLVLYAPTWRSDPKDRIDLSLDELQRLDRLFAAHNAVIGFRMHRNMVRHRQYFPMASSNVVQLGDIPDVNILMRLCDAVVTDYSSLYLDFMLLNRPVFLYTPDLARYRQTRGLNYDPGLFMPHETEITTFDQLHDHLRGFLEGRTCIDSSYISVRARFHSFEADGKASERLLQASGLWQSEQE